jgi:hypothetical protein
MSKVITKPEPAPRFAVDKDGNAVDVLLDPTAYISLLVGADVFDPAYWPPGKEAGAALLSRIREIEAACIAAHGAFDWEKLEPAVQDEYDILTVELGRLHFGRNGRPLEDVGRELGLQ